MKTKAFIIGLLAVLLVGILLFNPGETVGSQDFLGRDGIRYSFTGHVLKLSALRAPLEQVTDKISSDSAPTPLAPDKVYATAHGRGTTIYQLESYLPAFRVGVRRGRKVYVYEASYNNKARTARELLDIGDKLVKVEITADTQVVTITDQETLEKLSQYILSGAVNHEQALEIVFSSAWHRDYRITFFLKDNTSVSKIYYMSRNHLWPGIQLEEEFKAFFYQLLNN